MITQSGMYFEDIYVPLRHHLLFNAPAVDVGQWHAKDTGGNALLITRELEDVSFEITVPNKVSRLVDEIKPNLPWAEDHFAERVGGVPLNPGEQYKNWPWYKGNVDQHRTQGEAFSHTYMERYWPKFAGETSLMFISSEPLPDDFKFEYSPGQVMELPSGAEVRCLAMRGLRFEYGDLVDVVDLLKQHPMTRQAYLPVWFPEDTGAVHGERVPCSLGYHFMIRRGYLSCRYYLRSCDFVRHFRDDVYLTARLMQWICNFLELVQVGKLVVHISSLHIMEGDVYRLTEELKNS